MPSVETLTATELVVTIPAPSSLSLPQIALHVTTLEFMIELAGAMAKTVGYAWPYVAQEGDERRERNPYFYETVQIVRVRYGSPFQIVIDLASLQEFLTGAGVAGFIAVMHEMASVGPTAWKTLEEALKLRRDRVEARRNAKPNRLRAIRAKRSPSPEFTDHPSLQPEDLISLFLRPMVDAVANTARENEVRIEQSQIRDTALRCIEIHEERAEIAGEFLSTRTVRIEFE